MKHYYSRFFLSIFLLSLSLISSAQYDEVMKASQFGGVTNVSFNPAIADNRMKVDVNLLTAGLTLNNNYIGLDHATLTNHDLFNTKNFQENYLHERLNGGNKSVYLSADAQGPFSFMFGWGRDKSNKNAIAVTWNIHSITNIDNVSEKLARISYWGLGSKADSISKFNFQNFQNQNLAIKHMTWMDYGVTYSRVVYDKGAHMVKAGATLKFIVGVMGAYLYSDNINYQFNNYDSLTINKSDVRYGHNKGIGDAFASGGTKISSNIADYFSKPSVAADLGVIYEWRPNKEKYHYDMDCKEGGFYKNHVNKYKLAVGFSVIDIGRLKFPKSDNSRSFTADIHNWQYKKEPIKDVASFDSVVNSRFRQNDPDATFTLWLPTRFNIFVDWEIWKGFGVNVNSTISPVMSSARNQVHYPSTVALTPRYDHAWGGAYLPISYDSYGNFNVGAGIRLGPIFISSSNVITTFARKYVYNFNLQAGVKITIPNTMLKDKDKDKVSNRKDKCKKEQGPCTTGGCPDRDGDGVIDAQDSCPDVAGLKEFHGCPDRDGDGIIDAQDSCPDVKGPKELFGCPDSDGDGVIDKLDECPAEKGPKELNGCPDRDSDGVADKVDDCPDLAGDKAHKGCPDTDKDGLYDNEDKCPREAGPIENGGCPYPDTDGDGILDKDDACPKVPGVAENKGCPKLEKKEAETIKYAFQNLEFETGKDVILTKSYPSLNELAKLLVDKKTYGLKIEGHTDNVGKEDMNLELSRKRAEAVKTYLVKKGVDESKLETAGFGMTKPIADNATAAGRQKNRRVEMNIVFKSTTF